MDASHIEFDRAPTIASRQIIGPSSRRRAIRFYAPAVGRVTLSNDPVLGDGVGFVLAAGQTPREFNVQSDGEMVQRPWFALYSAGASGVGWNQVMV